MINAVLIDDEADSIGVMLIQLTKHCPGVNVMATFSDSRIALQYLQEHTPDIVFLDIEMPHLNGFELLTQLGKFAFKVIFVSAYDQFGIKAVKISAFDYLVKPVDPEELKETIARLMSSTDVEGEDVPTAVLDKNILPGRLLVPIGSELEFIAIEDIIRCEADDNYCTIYTIQNDKILLSKTLKYIETQLPNTFFMRTHNSHLINTNFIKKYIKTDGGYFELKDGTTIPLSRTKKEEILKLLGIT